MEINENHRILIVDDDSNLVNSLLRNFRKQYEMETAFSGAEGLEIVQSNKKLSVVISDLQMPGMNGLEFLKKAKEINPELVTIILSGTADLPTVLKAVNEGNVFKFLLKPSSHTELSQAINESLEQFTLLQNLKINSTQDSLTGLLNHKTIIDTLALEIKKTYRYSNDLSILMIDIDFFKHVNDNHGHLAGDTILKHVSEIIKKSIREIDYAGRYGGEEFLLIFPETDLKGTAVISERLRETVAKHDFGIEGLHITISGGVASYSGIENEIELIDSADKRLYFSKENGRNRITLV